MGRHATENTQTISAVTSFQKSSKVKTQNALTEAHVETSITGKFEEENCLVSDDEDVLLAFCLIRRPCRLNLLFLLQQRNAHRFGQLIRLKTKETSSIAVMSFSANLTQAFGL